MSPYAMSYLLFAMRNNAFGGMCDRKRRWLVEGWENAGCRYYFLNDLYIEPILEVVAVGSNQVTLQLSYGKLRTHSLSVLQIFCHHVRKVHVLNEAWAWVGLFNTGTNILSSLLEKNCRRADK